MATTQMVLSDVKEAKLVNASALAFILAGKAVFTLVSKRTAKRYTYKVVLAKPRHDKDATRWFVKLLSGPSNTSDYTYLGMVKEGVFMLTPASMASMASLPIVAFKWAFDSLVKGQEPVGVEIWHEGHCGRCGRPLTVPQSIAQGFGPECINLVSQ